MSFRACGVATLLTLLVLLSSAARADARLYLSSTDPAPVDHTQGQPLTAVSCVPEQASGLNRCFALDTLAGKVASFYPGRGPVTVNSKVIQGGYNWNFTDIACQPDAYDGYDTCFATDSFGSNIWSFSPIVPVNPFGVAVGNPEVDGRVFRLACTSVCAAIDTANHVDAWQNTLDGITTTTIDPGHKLTAVSCHGTLCAVGDDGGAVVTFTINAESKLSAQTRTVIDPGHALEKISCTGALYCAATDAAGGEVSFDPSAPTHSTGRVVMDPGATSAPPVSCWSLDCVLVEQDGTDAVGFDPRTPNATTQYHLAYAGSAQPTAISCETDDDGAPSGQCTVVYYDGQAVNLYVPSEVDSDSGSSPLGVLMHGDVFLGMACPSASQCTGIGTAGIEATYNPQDPSTPTIAHLPTGIRIGGLACATTTLCVVTDGYALPAGTVQGGVVTFDPQAPASAVRRVIEAGHALRGVACPSATSCTAVDDAGRELTFDPAAPGLPVPQDVGHGSGLEQIACPAATQCTATSDLGTEYTFDPQAPAGHTAIASAPAAGRAIACPTVSECTIASPLGGVEWTFNPRSSNAPSATTIDAAGLGFSSVACFSADTCLAFDPNHGTVRFNPHSSSDLVPQATDTGASFHTLAACPTSTECSELDDSGNTVTLTLTNE